MTPAADSNVSKYQRRVRRRVQPGRCLPAMVTADEVLVGAEWFFDDRANCQLSPGRRVDRSYVLTTLRAVASRADYRTGRYAEVSRFTIMRETGLSESTVKRCLALLQKVGFLHVLAVGYRNKNTKHAEANVYQLTLPDDAAEHVLRSAPPTTSVDNSDPVPLQGEVLNTVSPKSRVNTRPARGPRDAPKSSKPRGGHLPRTEYEFARDLRRRWPWLRNASVPQIARVIRQRHVDPSRWRYTKDLDNVVNYESSRLPGGYYRIPTTPREPLAVLSGFLAFVLPPVSQPTPEERRAARRRSQSTTPPPPQHIASEADDAKTALIIAQSNAEIRQRNAARAAEGVALGNAMDRRRLQAAREELDTLRRTLTRPAIESDNTTITLK